MNYEDQYRKLLNDILELAKKHATELAEAEIGVQDVDTGTKSLDAESDSESDIPAAPVVYPIKKSAKRKNSGLYIN
ncbi:MAG: hypothetical protein FWC55_00870 [Firmicutes bacterium]|nr:hypothetical protein [Bacillota bacterium]